MSTTLINVGATLRGCLDRTDKRQVSIVAAAIFFAVVPLEMMHLVSLLVGALGYMLLEALQPRIPAKSGSNLKPCRQPSAKPIRGSDRCMVGSSAKATGESKAEKDTNWRVRPAVFKPKPSTSIPDSIPGTSVPEAPAKIQLRQPSVVPVAAPTFESQGWDSEVQELVKLLSPTPESEAAINAIAKSVQQLMQPVLPHAEVLGFANGNPFGGTAFGVAVPEVDIVLRLKTGAADDMRKLQKSTIRSCTDRLVGSKLFKFRRSAFRGPEPKVTLIAQVPNTGEAGVPMNLSVNSKTPIQCAALLAECSRQEPLALDLALLVRRWAKDRGLSHTPKGHLSPYCWTLLAIYYLQVGIKARDEAAGSLLPPLAAFVAVATGKSPPGLSLEASSKKPSSQKPSVGNLFRGFLQFYADFDWSREAVSVRNGLRSPPSMLSKHILQTEDGKTQVGPSIEDPFEIATNLGSCLSHATFERLKEELQRARRISIESASITELLEPWAPPEAEATVDADA